MWSRLVWVAWAMAVLAPVGLLAFGHNLEFFRALCWGSTVVFTIWIVAALLQRHGELWPGFVAYGLALFISASVVGGIMDGEQPETRPLAGFGLWFLAGGLLWGAARWVVLLVRGNRGKSEIDAYCDRTVARFQQAVKVDEQLDRLIAFDKRNDMKAKRLLGDVKSLIQDQERDALPISMQTAHGVEYRDRYLQAFTLIRDKADDVVSNGGVHSAKFDAQLKDWGESSAAYSYTALAEVDPIRGQLGVGPRGK